MTRFVNSLLDPENVGLPLESRCCHVYNLNSTYWKLEYALPVFKVKVNIILYSDPCPWTRSALHSWQRVGDTNVYAVFMALLAVLHITR